MSDSLQTGQWVVAVTSGGGLAEGYLIEGNQLHAVEGRFNTSPWWFVFPIYRDDDNDGMLESLRDILADGAWMREEKYNFSWRGLRTGFHIFGVMTVQTNENTRFVEALKHPASKKPTRRGKHRKMRIKEVIYGALDGDD